MAKFVQDNTFESISELKKLNLKAERIQQNRDWGLYEERLEVFNREIEELSEEVFGAFATYVRAAKETRTIWRNFVDSLWYYGLLGEQTRKACNYLFEKVSKEN